MKKGLYVNCMEILHQCRRLFLEKYSKGIWTTIDGTKIYYEDLSDKHLSNIPRHIYNNLYNRFFLSSDFSKEEIASFIYEEIPLGIIEEINDRNMYLDKMTFKVYLKEINPPKKTSIPKPIVKKTIKSNINRNLFYK